MLSKIHWDHPQIEEVPEVNVSVGKEFEEFVKSKVASGDYASASEVVRDGLRLLKERERILEAKLQAIRGEIQKGVDQALAGDLLDGPAAMEDLRRDLRKGKS